MSRLVKGSVRLGRHAGGDAGEVRVIANEGIVCEVPFGAGRPFIAAKAIAQEIAAHLNGFCAAEREELARLRARVAAVVEQLEQTMLQPSDVPAKQFMAWAEETRDLLPGARPGDGGPIGTFPWPHDPKFSCVLWVKAPNGETWPASAQEIVASLAAHPEREVRSDG